MERVDDSWAIETAAGILNELRPRQIMVIGGGVVEGY